MTYRNGMLTWTGGGSGAAWGSITGTLSAQTDLQTALDAKANLSGATFTGKVTVPAANASTAFFNIGGAGTIGPSSVSDGDLWLGGSSLQIRISGTTTVIPVLNQSNTFSANMSFSAALTGSGTLNLTGSTGGSHLFASSTTTGTITIGGTGQSGLITIGRSTATHTLSLDGGVTASGNTKTLNLGTGGDVGSTTNITIGSTNGTSVTGNGTWSITGTLTASNLSGTNTGDETNSTILSKLSAASGGGTTNYLRADGTWAAPPGSGGLADGDKGDITVSGGATVWTIDNDVVTFAKMQNASAASVLVGRGAGGGAGDFQEITLGTNLSMSGTTLNASGGGGGGGTTLTSGVTTINFGAFPGASDAKLTVTGQAAILGTSRVKAYLIATATADHSADEHWVETIEVMAGNIVAATGFDIYAKNTNTLSEPVAEQWASTRVAGPGTGSNQVRPAIGGGQGTRLYGQFTVAWEWY